MRSLKIVVGSVVFVLAAAVLAIRMAAGQGASPGVLSQEVQGDNRREIVDLSEGDAARASPQQPAIGFIDSPSATCYQPDPALNNCYISWYYLSVNASPNYMITMTAVLNDYGAVANVQGFFQTSMYVPYNMLGQGVRVPCGALGSGGNSLLGRAYAYTIRARDSANLSSANYGTVFCPAFTP
jgi:hypothetical protein